MPSSNSSSRSSGSGSGSGTTSSSSSSSSLVNVGDDGSSCGDGVVNYIDHQVSMMDTLAGVAIKYGVEVGDIKRMNGLATDLQMFALKSLQIPLLRRHPPSPTFSTPPREISTGRTPTSRTHSYTFESFQSRKMKSPHQKVSPAMSTLQNYYGLKSPNPKDSTEGTEMAVYGTRKFDHCDEGLQYNGSPISDSPLNRLHKCGLLANGSVSENGMVIKDVPITEVKDGEGERSNDKYVRRRQNAEADSRSGTPEKLLKEEIGGGNSSSFSPMTGKGLALRPKSVSRYSLVPDAESGWLSSTPLGMGDPLMADDGLGRVHKSLSTPSLQDQDYNNSSFVWLTSKWSLKPDLQALSARPIFDGVPKPITGRRNKAALD